MSWFELDSTSIVSRIHGSEAAARVPSLAARVPSLAASLWRGMTGFTVVSIAGFAPWALFGRWFYRQVGEVGLYAVCAAVFIGSSGLLLHRLILGPGSRARFYKLFGIAFAAYSTAWIVGWMSLRGRAGSLAGLTAGTALMGWILTTAFEARGAWVKVAATLLGLNALGYFAGAWMEGSVIALGGLALAKPIEVALAKLSWAVCYGIGFGAGLGLAFHACQADARALLASRSENP